MGSPWARCAAMACAATSVLHSWVAVAQVYLAHVTAPDGAKLHINPQYITKLYPTKEALNAGPNQMVVTGARCVITMADGKFVSVKEPCEYVLTLVEGKPKK